MKRIAIRVVVAVAGVLACAAIVGSLYEAHARRAAIAAFPPTGRLIDIGGRRIHLDCRGSGSPIVVFESGLGPEGALSWANIHDQVAAKTRTCAYSRAGILWSDPAPGPRAIGAAARDLHAALENAGERPPLVLVGHSLGGPYAMIYTKYYGQDVAGIVFVDASHPDQVKRQTIIAGHSPAMPVIMQKAIFWASQLGITRMTQSERSIPGSPFATQALAAYWPSSIEAVLQETAILEASLAEAGTFRDLGARPIIVLTADRPFSEQQIRQGRITHEQASALQALWRTMQEEIAGWSTDSEHHVLGDASHFIHWTHPDVVIAAIGTVVDRVRGAPPPGRE